MLLTGQVLFKSTAWKIYNVNRSIHFTRYLLFRNSTSKTLRDASSSINSTYSESRKMKLDLTFENSEVAYKKKPNFELIRGLFVFYTFSVKFIVDNQTKVIIYKTKSFSNYFFFFEIQGNRFGT